MPHLSPMIWSLAPIMFLLLLIPTLTASMWWSQHPNFPLIATKSSSLPRPWNWA